MLNSPSILARSCSYDVVVSYLGPNTIVDLFGTLTSLGRFLMGEVSAMFVRCVVDKGSKLNRTATTPSQTNIEVLSCRLLLY